MPNPLISRSFATVLKLFAISVALLAGRSAAQPPPPPGGNTVVYAPNAVATINIPAGGSWFYDLSITSPSTLPAGVTTSVALVATPNTFPSSISAETAGSYISFSSSTLTFTGPSQTRVVRVTFTLPVTAPAGAYQFFLRGQGWPATVNDGGTSINAVALIPDNLLPPSISISSPEDGSVYTYNVSHQSLPIDVSILAAGQNESPVLTLEAYIVGEDEDGEFLPATPLALNYTGLGTASASGQVILPVTRGGTYTLVTLATNRVGTATESSQFYVNEFYPPPVVRFTHAPDATYDYYAGSPALEIPVGFEGVSFEGGVQTLTATLNGQPIDATISDLGTLLASGEATLNLLPGTYTLTATVTDEHGSDSISTQFTVVLVSPEPEITIDDPLDGAVFTHVVGTPNLNIPFAFVTSTSDGFTISSVSAQLNGANVALGSVSGLNTQSAAVSGVLNNLPAGTYTLRAYGVSAGITVSTSVTFTIKDVAPQATPPTVTINTPAPGTVYTLQSQSGGCGSGSSISVPLNFTGRSTTSGAVITKLTATLNGSTVSISTQGLNTATATGKATLNVTKAGTYTIQVTATDKYGTATAATTFVVVAPNTKVAVKGSVFFDVTSNGTRDGIDYGLAGISVKLLNSAKQAVATATTDSSGNYSFSIASGSYTVSVVLPRGYSYTTTSNHSINVGSSAVTVPATGLGLNFGSIRGMCANGFTIGYWKNNIDKALAGKKNGVQVSASALNSYTTAIRNRSGTFFTSLTLQSASATMSSTSSQPADLLAKQLVASEYNYANGAFIGGDRALTQALINYAGYVLKNKSSFTKNQIIFVKDWCDAYNNSHGGAVNGPTK